jgi:hypothetical protein
MGKLYSEWMMGKDPNLVLAKVFLSQLRAFIGHEKMRIALDEFAKEEKQYEQEIMPPAINPNLKNKVQNERLDNQNDTKKLEEA